MNIPDDWQPSPYPNGDCPDWHAALLREVAKRLGVGSDAYHPLMGAAAKIEMFRRGEPYADAITMEGGAPDHITRRFTEVL